MATEMVYFVGFVIALLFVLFGIDDLFWDIYSLFSRKKKPLLDLDEVNQKIPRMMAISIAAWHEDKVISDVVDHLVFSAQYPQDLYRIFIGVYPNDQETIQAVEGLSRRHGNVVMVINEKDGPTSKADNLNCVLRTIARYEQEHDLRFVSVTIHDAEDVIHPNEFKITNYLIDDYDALQFPVFPLLRSPRLRNFIKMLTPGTYADEFAESHFKTLVVRDAVGFVPSAGTGFVLSRSVLEKLGDEVFPQGSMTEDYLLSLQMKQQGFSVHYVLEQVARVNATGRTVNEYVATRSMFPQTFAAAVKQKTRWVYGISMQSASLADIFRKGTLTIRERLLLYKDQKAKFANFILLPGYCALLYFFLQMANSSLPLMFPRFSVSWWLCICLLVMMLERQALRGLAIMQVYGIKSALFSTLLPPLFPLRLIWGNAINFTATLFAWRKKFHAGASAPKKNRKASAWDKTDHEFLPAENLVTYRRLLGDTLLEMGYATPSEIKAALVKASTERKLLGEVLVEEEILEKNQLIHAYALHRKTAIINSAACSFPPVELSPAEQEHFSSYKVRPLVRSCKGWIVSANTKVWYSEIEELEAALGQPVFCVFEMAQEREESAAGAPVVDVSLVEGMLGSGKITLSQVGLALGYASLAPKSLGATIREMGLGQPIRKNPRVPSPQRTCGTPQPLHQGWQTF